VNDGYEEWATAMSTCVGSFVRAEQEENVPEGGFALLGGGRACGGSFAGPTTTACTAR